MDTLDVLLVTDTPTEVFVWLNNRNAVYNRSTRSYYFRSMAPAPYVPMYSDDNQFKPNSTDSVDVFMFNVVVVRPVDLLNMTTASKKYDYVMLHKVWLVELPDIYTESAKAITDRCYDVLDKVGEGRIIQ